MTVPQQVAAFLDADRIEHEVADAQPVTVRPLPMLTDEQCDAMDDCAEFAHSGR